MREPLEEVESWEMGVVPTATKTEQPNGRAGAKLGRTQRVVECPAVADVATR